MTQAKHTQGPWRLNAGNETEIMSARRNVARAHCGAMTGIRVDEAEANARLIAAAPDLLAACEEILSETTNNISGISRDDALSAISNISFYARAAIAKAKGE